ncbi:WD repeat-containing protein RUP2 [Striga asiatica]|uniref:WD repeat-containing protein RUP2 n=1 Tax=Striga asiatica TaxID=4170 RepID=A0A5A7R3P4_STRAF|nr:WD repeat-containing protein RUP2 [Striga asiatica]
MNNPAPPPIAATSSRDGDGEKPAKNPKLPLDPGGDAAEEDDEEEKPRCEWDFTLSAVISSSPTPSAAPDAIGVVEFDPTGEFLATGGIARKIRIYGTERSLRPSAALLDHASACDFYLCTPAKLSSLKWRPGSGSRLLGSGDYDGVVTEYDLESRAPVFERDEHGGRRVWSLDYHPGPPPLGASGSDDGTVQMWDPRCPDGGRCLPTVRPGRAGPSPVCCVEFDPCGGPLMAAGCTDRAIYMYDLRAISSGPTLVLDGHRGPVTYTRFLDFRTLVSSSVDGSLIMWSTENGSPIRTFTGHANSRRFVGLSVLRDAGLLSCGSENNRVFVYDKRWARPIWDREFHRMADEEQKGDGRDPDFVSGVCWRQMAGDGRCMLVAGGSDGVLQAFEGERKVMQV